MPNEDKSPPETAAGEQAGPADRSAAQVPVPFARVVPGEAQRSFRLALVALVVVLLGLLGWIGWWWWETRGVAITVEFVDPRGLKAGAPLTLNGVRVGEIRKVTLSPRQKVVVHIRLTASDRVNALITRKTSVFWIPQFQADLTRGIRNVQAVFSAEVAVRPGTGPPRYHFIGQAYEPPNVWLRDGELPVVLRAPRNRGVAEGSAVFYRGLVIGEVVRTQLSRDSSKFEAWLRIFAEFGQLVRKNSHFVDSSGIDLEVGLGGMSVNMESVQSMLEGSVTLFTPTDYGAPAEPGRDFTLELRAQDPYYDWSPYIEFPGYQSMYEAATRQRTPGLAQATLSWSYARGWGWLPPGEAVRSGLVLQTTAGVLAPENLLVPEQTPATDVTLSIGGEAVPPEDLEMRWRGDELALAEAELAEGGWPADATRAPEELESCSVYGPGGQERALDKEYLTVDADRWRVTREGLFDAAWHGAAVMSSRDGKLIGLLFVDDYDRATVHPLPADAPFFAATTQRGPAEKPEPGP